MIDPTKITNFCRSIAEQEEFLLFSVSVAGKNSKVQAQKLQQFLSGSNNDETPFQYIARLGEGLTDAIKACKLGQYDRISRCFAELSKKDITSVSFLELLSVSGIGPKTANFFLMHSRKDYVGAALDTHILKFIREQGYDAPKATPPVKQYLKWQTIFLDLCARLWPNRTIAEIDLEIWKSYITN